MLLSQVSAGYGKGAHGWHVVAWEDISSAKAVSGVTTDDSLRSLEHFTGS